MKQKHIDEMRSFNRFYTAIIGVLNNKFLDSNYSLAALRVLQLISFGEGITASEIIGALNIDKSYLSRILQRLEKNKLVSRKSSPADGRSYHLFLTPKGVNEFRQHDAASDRHINEILSQLNEPDRIKLISSMKQIKEILSGPDSLKSS